MENKLFTCQKCLIFVLFNRKTNAIIYLANFLICSTNSWPANQQQLPDSHTAATQSHGLKRKEGKTTTKSLILLFMCSNRMLSRRGKGSLAHMLFTLARLYTRTCRSCQQHDNQSPSVKKTEKAADQMTCIEVVQMTFCQIEGQMNCRGSCQIENKMTCITAARYRIR